MTIKPVLLLLLLATVALFSCNRHPASHEGEVLVELKAVQNAAGWGYEIYVDKKLYIKQDHIPAVAGGKAFATKEDALKTGNVVKDKLEHGQVPAMTVEELKALKVIP